MPLLMTIIPRAPQFGVFFQTQRQSRRSTSEPCTSFFEGPQPQSEIAQLARSDFNTSASSQSPRRSTVARFFTLDAAWRSGARLGRAVIASRAPGDTIFVFRTGKNFLV